MARPSRKSGVYASLYTCGLDELETPDEDAFDDFPRRKITFPYQARCNQRLGSTDDNASSCYAKYRSESCMQQVKSNVTVRDLKQQWSSFIQRHGHTGYFPVGILISSKPRPTTRSDDDIDEATTEEEDLTLVQFGTSKDRSTIEDTTKVPRRVVFADDIGKPLCEVKTIECPEEVPTEIQDSYIWTIIYEKIAQEQQVPIATWFRDFQLPIDDEKQLECRFESQGIALENMELENELPCRIFGTIRLTPIYGNKEPIIRVTTNDWQSYQDHETRLEPTECEETYNLFTFDVDIPKDDERVQAVEFSIYCFIDDGRLWDNNSGQNYRILSEQTQMWWSGLE